MKKALLTMAALLVLSLGVKAQDANYNDYELETFNWADFADLYDQAVQAEMMDDWFSDFGLFDFGDFGNRDVFELILPDHGGDTDVNAPLGSGIALLLGMGGAYFAVKKRKEEE